ncbi:MAG: sensor histidine kinase [Actinobacteria bacterium]|nr:sensor histidine kinase [Actinomycetota bacterium]
MTTEFAPPFPFRFFRSRVALPVAVAFFQVMGTSFADGHGPSRRPLDLLSFLLLLSGPALLTVRRKYPVPVLFSAFAVAATYELLGYIDGPIFISVAVAVVAAIMGGKRRIAVAVAALGYATFVWGEFALGLEGAPKLPEAIAVGAWLAALLTVPEVFRVRRERFIEEARSRAEERKRRASEERLRIAQELHDVIAHNISLINVQAGTALHLLEDRPDQARPALTAIKEASNEALGELRSVLDVLRDGSGGAPRSPTPGLNQIDSLIARMKVAGLVVGKRVEGPERSLSAPVDRSAFRIVQESLTNVTRHAAVASATVTLRYKADVIEVEITDDGHGAISTHSEGGNGIPGMRERALALGGEFEAGPRAGGGFRIRARLPYEAHIREDSQ